MGIFDYCCSINSEDCPLRKSEGQEFTYGTIYLIDKMFTKKIACEYSGYGYANHISGDDMIDIYDLGFKDDYFDCWDVTELDKCAFFACPSCSNKIKKEVKTLEDFFPKENPKEVLEKKLKKANRELQKFINMRATYNKDIRDKRKEIKNLLTSLTNIDENIGDKRNEVKKLETSFANMD
ncbi:hypothetical protein CPAV1605_203 [seawater metagenome]|uniref:Uncharacterized protein n=1 Tax=seawater metagenome TaxID=1561972 RepID=A0A5E8CH14_9ZZZZ